MIIFGLSTKQKAKHDGVLVLNEMAIVLVIEMSADESKTSTSTGCT